MGAGLLKPFQQLSLCHLQHFLLGQYLVVCGRGWNEGCVGLSKEVDRVLEVTTYTVVRVHGSKHVEGSVLDPARASLVGVLGSELVELAMRWNELTGARLSI